MILDLKKPVQQVKPCVNCGKDTTTTDGAELSLFELIPPNENRLSRQAAKKTIFRMRLCRDCMDKAETIISDWLDSPKEDERKDM